MGLVMRRFYRIQAILVCMLVGSLVFSSCAAIFHGSTDDVNFVSDPPGANVYVDGMLMGNTPMQLELKSNASYNVEFRMDGYLSRTVVLNNELMAGYLILDLIFIPCLVPIIVDAATGSWMCLSKSTVRAPLLPASK